MHCWRSPRSSSTAPMSTCSSHCLCELCRMDTQNLHSSRHRRRSRRNEVRRRHNTGRQRCLHNQTNDWRKALAHGRAASGRITSAAIYKQKHMHVPESAKVTTTARALMRTSKEGENGTILNSWDFVALYAADCGRRAAVPAAVPPVVPGSLGCRQ
jgi:hypothetical protein